MKIRKGIFWTAMLFISIVLFINTFAYMVFYFPIIPQAHQLYEDGLVVKIPQFHYAMVFAHGSWGGEGSYHDTYLSDDMYTPHSQNIPTLDLINELKLEGYNHIWLSQCGTGDSDIIDYEMIEGTWEPIYWDSLEGVSRKKSPGVSFPIWVGWFWRL